VKTILMKIFLMVSAMACMFQGLMLLSVGLGKLSPEKLITLYEQLLNTPAAFKTIQVTGTFFILLGFTLLLLASRTKQIPKMITVEQEGQSLSITYKTVIDFIEQVGSQNPFVTHFAADFIIDHKKEILIPVDIEMNGVPSVQNVLNEIEHTLRAEIENVFGLRKFKFDFHVQGVSIDPKKKYFASPEALKVQTPVGEIPVKQEPTLQVPEQVVVAQANKVVVRNESIIEENFSEKRSDEEVEQLFETAQKDIKKPSLVARLLWGK